MKQLYFGYFEFDSSGDTIEICVVPVVFTLFTQGRTVGGCYGCGRTPPSFGKGLRFGRKRCIFSFYIVYFARYEAKHFRASGAIQWDIRFISKRAARKTGSMKIGPHFTSMSAFFELAPSQILVTERPCTRHVYMGMWIEKCVITNSKASYTS